MVLLRRFSVLTLTAILGGCYVSNPVKEPDAVPEKVRRDQNFGKLFGDSLTFGGNKKDSSSSAASIAVNAFLWRASLDALSFMPLASADPFGGVIITDWHVNSKHPNERLKINVIISDRRLRSDALKVRVFRQILNRYGWMDVPVTSAISRDLENIILKRARELRTKSKF
jgi:hypothetical protein